MTFAILIRVATPRAALALLCLASLACSPSYQPEGQFWPANSGPLDSSGSSAVASGGSIDNGTGGSNGVVPGAGSGGNDVSAGGGVAAGGNSASSGGDSSGGAFAAGGYPGFGGSPAVGGNPGSGGNTASAGSAAVGGSSAGGSTSTSCSLSVTVTTTAPGGTYKPRNVGAIWVADSSGRFLKSLEVWGSQRLNRVVAWNAATKSAGAAGNKVDAVTSATLSTHRTHNVSWNCRDYKEQAVPDGSYRVYFEVEDSNNAGPNHFETFSKGPSAVTVQGSATNFNGIVLAFKP